MELFTFFGAMFPIPALLLISGSGLYWSMRAGGAGRELSISDQHAIDDAFNALMMLILAFYALIARGMTGVGLLAAVGVVGMFVGVRFVRRRGFAPWVIGLTALTVGCVWWRLVHHAGPLCIKLINNVG